jgi:integrase
VYLFRCHGYCCGSLRAHLAEFAGPDPEALVFPVANGAPLRRSNFNRMSGWTHAVEAIGARGLHFHDLRHTGSTFAAASGAAIKDLMARMGHDSERAAMIYQHQVRGADRAITRAIDAHRGSRAGPGRRRRRRAGRGASPGELMAR